MHALAQVATRKEALLSRIPRIRTVRQKIVAGYVASLLGVVVVAVVIRAETGRQNQLVQESARVERALLASTEVSERLSDMETGVRGFVITGFDSYLEPYLAGVRSLPAAIGAMRANAAAPEQVAQVDNIAALADRWRADVLAREIDARRRGGSEAADLVATGVGKSYFDAIRDEVERFEATQKQQLDALAVLRQRTSARQGVELILGALIAALTSLAISLGVARSIGRRARALEQAARAVAGGDLRQRIPTRADGDELDDLARSFERMRATLDELVGDKDRLVREAESATQAKSRFLASVSHELRTPLNAILGFSDILSEQTAGKLTARHERYLSNIHGAGEHLLTIINDVLDLAKVEAGRIELRLEILDLADLARPVVASAAQDAASRGLAFESHLGSDARVRVDAVRVRQVLFNLLSNAVKFTPSGGRVELRLAVDDGMLLAEVSDTGVGFPTESRDRIFQPFERFHEGKVAAPGTGLGLALTKQLVELHRGTIAVETELGRGSTFRLRFPGAAVEAPVGERVLVVEDETRDAELVAAIAADVGLASERVTSAAEAIEAIHRERPSGVVLDLYLRESHGSDVLAAIKLDPTTKDLPVVVVSVDENSERYRLMGADFCLTKPLNRDELRRWLAGLAERSATLADSAHRR